MAGIRASIARLSSGVKMLFIMSGALLPLGLIALFASLQYAHTKRLQHDADAHLIAIAEARQIDLVVNRAANVVLFAVGSASQGAPRCAALLEDAARLLPIGTRIALHTADGRVRCASAGMANAVVTRPPQAIGVGLELLPSGGLRFTIRALNGSYGIGDLTPAALRASVGSLTPSQGLALTQGAIRLVLADAKPSSAIDRSISVPAPIGGGQLLLTATIVTPPVSLVEVLLLLLPLLMWAAAAVIGSVVINQLLLRPLGRLQRAVADAAEAGAASGQFVMPRLQTPAREIRTLAQAFETATAQIAQREQKLEEALRHQVLLTREVHHRVKNNLQVVASLINLHARGTSGDVATAYASIQRRVDALAVVHRNHYAELEKHHGVSLRTLVAELTANLRATAPAQAAHFGITLNIALVHVSQDTAVPVAFLLTEIIELLMYQVPDQAVRIQLNQGEDPDRATLLITSPGLHAIEGGNDPQIERCNRIVAGIARQLRSALAFDAEAGHYSVVIPILRDPEPESPRA
jgi:two-component sensor histidine kinase